MGFLYRLGAAALCSIGITLFTLVMLGQPVTPGCFYGSIAAGVLLSYADDWRAIRAFNRMQRRVR